MFPISLMILLSGRNSANTMIGKASARINNPNPAIHAAALP